MSGVMCRVTRDICRVFSGHMECVGCLGFKRVGGENGTYSVGCSRDVWSVWECVSVV